VQTDAILSQFFLKTNQNWGQIWYNVAMDPSESYLKSSYQDIDKEFERQVKLTEAVPRARKLFYYIWFAIDVVLFLLFASVILWYVSTGIFSEKRTVARIGLNADVHHELSAENQASPLVTSDTKVFSESGVHDFYAEIENANEQWYAEFRYYFKTPDFESDFSRAIVLPGKKQPLISFSQDFEGGIRNAELIIEDIKWHRITAHTISDIDFWIQDHENFAVENITHGTGADIGGRPLITTSFSIKNNSSYSYWDADFYIILQRGNIVTGVNTVRLAGFESGESREVTVNWFRGAQTNATVSIVPNINFFDDEVYMPHAENAGVEIIDLL